MINNDDYIYAVTLVQVLTNQLLDRNDIERMLGAKDAKEAYRILNDTDYSTHIGDVSRVEDFQEVIDAGLSDTRKLLRDMTPERWVLNMAWYKYDAHNTKTLLKAKLTGKTYEDVAELLIPWGKIKLSALTEFIFADEIIQPRMKGDEKPRLQRAVQRSKELYEETGSLTLVDLHIDRAFLKVRQKIAKGTGSKFLQSFMKAKTDIHNIMAFCRSKDQHVDPERVLKKALTVGGTIRLDKFNDNLKEDWDAVNTAFSFCAYSDSIAKGLESYKETGSFRKLERLLQNDVLEMINDARFLPFGIEPILNYWWLKEFNAQIIRMIMVGKLNGLDTEMIREEIPHSYVN